MEKQYLPRKYIVSGTRDRDRCNSGHEARHYQLDSAVVFVTIRLTRSIFPIKDRNINTNFLEIEF